MGVAGVEGGGAVGAGVVGPGDCRPYGLVEVASPPRFLPRCATGVTGVAPPRPRPRPPRIEGEPGREGEVPSGNGLRIRGVFVVGPDIVVASNCF